MEQDKKKKFLIIGHKTSTVVNFRGDLLCDIKRNGYEVVAIVPDNTYRDFFSKNNIKVRVVKLERNSLSISNTLEWYKNLKKIIKEEQPDIVFSFTIKPVIFGSIAAKKVGMENIYSLISGLGMLFCSDGVKIRALRFVGGKLYRYALRFNKKVIFQNPDDINEFVKLGYAKKEQCELVNGSGVNLKKFPRKKLPQNKMSFLMVSRIIKEKGVAEYFEAAKIVKEKYPDVNFAYIGMMENNKNAIKLDDLKSYIKTGVIDYIPETNEVVKYMASCSVFVLPTYYREGIPRTLLEATAMGRPIITTDTPGCKETIIDGKNGVFVKTRDAKDLAEKMIWMIEHKDILQKMGDESYKICLEKFTIDKVNGRMMEIMGVE